jgi:hypothetical protein
MFTTNGRTSASISARIVHSCRNIGIGTSTPKSRLQVGNTGILKTGSSTADYSLIGS